MRYVVVALGLALAIMGGSGVVEAASAAPSQPANSVGISSQPPISVANSDTGGDASVPRGPLALAGSAILVFGIIEGRR